MFKKSQSILFRRTDEKVLVQNLCVLGSLKFPLLIYVSVHLQDITSRMDFPNVTLNKYHRSSSYRRKN